MPATPNAQQAAQESIGQEMTSASTSGSTASASAAPTPSSAAGLPDEGVSTSEPDRDEEGPDRTGLIEEVEAPTVDSQTQMAYAHMRANAGGGYGAQPGA